MLYCFIFTVIFSPNRLAIAQHLLSLFYLVCDRTLDSALCFIYEKMSGGKRMHATPTGVTPGQKLHREASSGLSPACSVSFFDNTWSNFVQSLTYQYWHWKVNCRFLNEILFIVCWINPCIYVRSWYWSENAEKVFFHIWEYRAECLARTCSFSTSWVGHIRWSIFCYLSLHAWTKAAVAYSH